MKREDDGLVPIGEALADLPGPVKAAPQNPRAVADEVHEDPGGLQ